MAEITLIKRASKAKAELPQLVKRISGRPLLVGSPHTRAIQFLRNMRKRADLCHSAFYFYLFAKLASERSSDDVPIIDALKQDTIKNCALFTLATSIRAIYDVDTSFQLNPRLVANLGADDRERVAQYWGRGEDKQTDEARHAIRFLCRALGRFTRPINQSAATNCLLTQRIALIKAFGNRAVAHISIDDYSYTDRDLAHIVAVTSLIGAIVREFDDAPNTGCDYLIGLDKTASLAARQMFPGLDDVPRLFHASFVRGVLQPLYKGRLVDGVDYLSKTLLAAIGWDD